MGLLGRNEDILWFEDFDGKQEFLHPLAIEGFCIEGLLDYQFRQIGKDTFEMYAEISESASAEAVRAEMLKQMKNILAEKELDYVQFYVRFVDEILPDTRTGKKPLILSGESPALPDGNRKSREPQQGMYIRESRGLPNYRGDYPPFTGYSSTEAVKMSGV